MAPRSRTGCLTCRHRKLKCDEQRPVCGQCIKARRECVPSSGITFRHQQNPSMNGANHGEGSLKSFYGYKETFSNRTTWVNVPKDLTFVHTSNPYEDDEDGPGGAGGYGADDGDTTLMTDAGARYDDSGRGDMLHELAQAAYPAYATHGLEALSTVASQDQYSYAPPPAPMGQHDQHDQHGSPHAQFNSHPHSPTHNSNISTQNLDFILNPSSAGAGSNIDPRLHSDTSASPHTTGHPSFSPHSPENDHALSGPATTASVATAAQAVASLEDELRLRIQS